MPDELVQERPDKPRKMLRRRLVRLHDQGQTGAAHTNWIISSISRGLPTSTQRVKAQSGSPREENFAAGHERDVALLAQRRPHALEAAREDIHGEFAAAFRVFDEQRQAGREAVDTGASFFSHNFVKQKDGMGWPPSELTRRTNSRSDAGRFRAAKSAPDPRVPRRHAGGSKRVPGR